MMLSPKLRRAAGTVIVLAAVLIGVVALPSAPAAAAGELAVAIAPSQTTVLPAESGADIVFDLSVECTAVDSAGCSGMRATIPLPQEIDPESLAVEPNVVVSSWSFADGVLTIIFVDPFVGGTTATIPVTMATRNGSTPNGYSWDVSVTLSAEDSVSVSASTSASVTARANVVVDKSLLDDDNRVPVEANVTYRIEICDDESSLGRLDLESATVVDSLPAGAVYVASNMDGQYQQGAHTVTWTLTAVQLALCSHPESLPQLWVTVRYPGSVFGPTGDVNKITRVSNRVDLSGTPYGESTLTTSDVVEHEFTNDPPPGVFAKTARTPTVFAGDYLPGQFEAAWTLGYDGSGAVDHGVIIHDRMPCATPFQGDPPDQRSVHVSPIDGEPVCSNPTFLVGEVEINPDSATNPSIDGYLTAITAGWRPRWIDINGQSGDFNLVAGTASRFQPPSGVTVAEVLFPHHPEIVFSDFGDQLIDFITIRGHMIPDDPDSTFVNAPEGAAVVNRAEFVITDLQGAPRIELFDTDTMRVLPSAPIASIAKAVGGNGNVQLLVANFGLRPIEGVVVTDLLPANVTFGELAGVTVAGQPVPLSTATVETIANYGGSGRQLVRITLNTPVDTGGFASGAEVAFTTAGLAVIELPPGETQNSAQLFVNSPTGAELASCFQTTTNALAPPLSSDPLDLDGNGTTADDRFCESTAVVRGSTGSVVLTTVKRVKGDLDANFVGFPAVGSVNAGGTAEYRLELTNRSPVDIVNTVVYDVLPSVGDSSVRTQIPRGSQFRAVLTEVPDVADTPAGATPVVEYSTSTNPCRGEVTNVDRDQWPVGCDDDWSTTVPPAGLEAVTALRISVLGTLPSRSTAPNVVVELTVAIPDDVEVGEVAWNSFAVAGERATGGRILPTEPPKVGIARPLTDVELDKSVNGQSSATVLVGDTVTYRITARHGTSLVQNPDGSIVYHNPSGDAPSSALDVVVDDILPAAAAFVAGSASNCDGGPVRGSFDPASGRWELGDLHPGDSFDLCFQATTSGLSPIRNLAQVMSFVGPDDIDSVPGNMPPDGPPDEDDEDEAIVTPTAPDIRVAKTAGGLVANADGTFTASYQVTVSNVGSAAGSYVLVEQPSGPLTVQRLQISSSVLAQPFDAQTSVAVLPSRAIAAGAVHTYQVLVTFGIAPGVSNSDRTCLPGVSRGAVNGVIAGRRSAQACTDIPRPDVDIEKDAGTLTRVPGSADTFVATYQLVVTNTDPNPDTNPSVGPGVYDLVDAPDFGPGATITGVEVASNAQSAQTPAVQISQANGGQVGIVSNQPIGRNHRHVFDVTVTFRVSASMSDVARRCSDHTPQLGAFNAATITSAGVTTTADACLDIPEPTIQISKRVAQPLELMSGARYRARYVLEVSNGGGAPGQYSLSDTPDFGPGSAVEAVELINDPADTDTPATSVTDAAAPFAADIGPIQIDPGAVHRYLVVVTFSVAPDMTTADRQCDSVPTPGHGAFNRGTITVGQITRRSDACVDIPHVDLGITKSDGGAVATAGGDPFDYTITVTNVGDRDVNPDDTVTVVDDLPLGLSWVAPAPAGCVFTDATMTCEVAPSSLQAGESVDIVARARAVSGFTGSVVVNRAVVTTLEDPACGPEPCQPQECPSPGNVTIDADPSNNVACEPTPIVGTEPPAPAADVAIVKSAVPSTPVAPGASVRWDLAIINHGPATAVAVVVEDTVPASLVVTDVTSTTFQCTRDGNRIRCEVPTLAAGASGIVQVQTVVAPSTPAGTIRNVAVVGSSTPDINLDNNSDDATVRVEIPPQTESANPTPPTRLPLPRTGSEWTLLLLRAGLMILIAGIAVTLIARRRTSGANPSTD